METDLDTAAGSILIESKIEHLLSILSEAKDVRKVFNDKLRKTINESGNTDPVKLVLALAQVSDPFIDDLESTLLEAAELAKDKVNDKIKHLALVEGFIVFISELKPRSVRHLENFFAAATDGEWIDGLFMAHGKESEFRCIDRCSDTAKAEFGIANKK